MQMTSLRALTAGASLLLAAATINAQEPAANASPAPAAKPGASASPMMQLQAKRQQIMQLSQKLQAIQKETIAANPDLKSRQEAFSDKVMAEMATEDFKPKAAMDRIRTLQSKLKDESLEKEKRQSLVSEMRSKQQKLRMAQQKVLQSEEIKAQREQLDKDLMSAMKEHDPKAADLIAQFNQARNEYQQMMQSAMQQAASQQQGS